MRQCKGLCESEYNKTKLVRTSMEGLKHKFGWLFCDKCQVYINFRILKSYCCICCHDKIKIMRMRKVRKEADTRQKNNEKARRWYWKSQANRSKKNLYNKMYWKRKHTSLNETIPIN